MVRPKKSTDIIEPKSRAPLQKEDGTVARWYILGAIVQDERSRMIHSQVAWPILEAYYDKRGEGKSSYRFLAKATR